MRRTGRAFESCGRVLEVGGRDVQAYVAGDGPDVILLHGAASHSADFDFGLFDRLAARFRVTAFDRPGLGRSEALHGRGESFGEQAAHLDAAAAALGIARAVVVGHSFGGGVAMAWALDRPARVAAVTTLAGVTMPWPEDMDAFRRLASREPDGAALVPVISVTSERAFTHSTLETIFAPQPVPEGYAERLLLPRDLLRPTFRSNARQVARLREEVTRLARGYASLQLPVEVLQGKHDTVGSVMVHARQMARRLGNARLTELPGIGHMPHHADPDATVAAIIRAVARAGLR
ncbi:alpha/beta fold hydrolase [Tropicimonas sp. IMCC6043]|uniref:alpha/beta fold hydrolase n=1 Tax=Tropicimonas sp. IMCC6043 TaxID=2510645 RepID=UPI0013EB8B13|nr:alpha/beta hydrolase [Tropicimonas sp. IMCC6043]